jgi:serine/threonine-protein kinase RsbW
MFAHATLELPLQPWTLGVVRHALHRILAVARVDEDTRFGLAVALGEACGNAIRHAITVQPYRVTIEADPDRCRLEVVDEGAGFDAEKAERGPRPDRAGGHGLTLIRAMVDQLDLVRLQPQGLKVVMVKHRQPSGVRAVQAGIAAS